MGELLSTIRRQQHQQPAICAVDEPPEQEETPPEARDESGRTALHRAAEAGDEAEARRLLTEGASVRAVDDRGQTPLAAAAGAGSAGLCAMLADAGADVNARDSLGRTALHAAAEAEAGGGDVAAVVKLLLRRGANPHSPDGCGSSTLHCALKASNLATAEVLVPTVGLELLRDDKGRTPLHWAAAKGTRDIVWQLLARAGGGYADRDGVGMTPLARALQARNRVTARVLMEAEIPGESASEADAFGRTELHWAALAGYPEVVRHLLERGFSPWAVDLCGRDALVWATKSGERQVVEQILEHADYRENADRKGQTALHVAAGKGDAAVVSLLLNRGADTVRLDRKGRSPLMSAVRRAHMDAAFHLATRGSFRVCCRARQKRTLLHWAAVGGDAEAVRELVAAGAPVNAVDARGKTAAALAVKHGHQEAAAVLIGADGFRVSRDNKGRTPLHGAAAAGWSMVALQLVELGADPHEGDKDMVSPVMLAERAGRHALASAMKRVAIEKLHPDSF